MSLTTATQSAFGVRGDVQEWEFEASAGQALGWGYQGTAIQSWAVLNPSGLQVASGVGGTLTTIAFTPQQSGKHRLVFEDVKSTPPRSAGLVGPLGYKLIPEPSNVATNHQPQVAAPITSTTHEDALGYSINLLAGATDPDASDVLNVNGLMSFGALIPASHRQFRTSRV